MRPHFTDQDDDETEPITPETESDNVIYLQHPTDPLLRLRLWRGPVAKTLIRYGYREISREEYEAEEK